MARPRSETLGAGLGWAVVNFALCFGLRWWAPCRPASRPSDPRWAPVPLLGLGVPAWLPAPRAHKIARLVWAAGLVLW